MASIGGVGGGGGGGGSVSGAHGGGDSVAQTASNPSAASIHDLGKALTSDKLSPSEKKEVASELLKKLEAKAAEKPDSTSGSDDDEDPMEKLLKALAKKLGISVEDLKSLLKAASGGDSDSSSGSSSSGSDISGG
ncbi:MAG: hypothetical protein ACRYF5_16605 [Janthinobacterium lividum]